MINGFVTIEGIEGAGKTTLARRLAEWLEARGAACRLAREPGGTRAGEMIRSILLDRSAPLAPEGELMLFEAARLQIMDEIVLPALNSGQWVILDRFCDSTTAYQGYGRGLDLDWIRSMNQRACRGRMPDVTLLLDIGPEEGLRRARSAAEAGAPPDRFETETRDFMERVREGLLELARNAPGRFRIIEASKPEEAVWREAVAALEAFADRR